MSETGKDNITEIEKRRNSNCKPAQKPVFQCCVNWKTVQNGLFWIKTEKQPKNVFFSNFSNGKTAQKRVF